LIRVSAAGAATNGRTDSEEVCYLAARMTQVDRPARIALFLPTMDDGGAEHVMLRLGAGFVARGHSVDLVVAIPGGPIESKIPTTLRVVNLSARRTTTALPALVRYLRRERPAALLSTLEHSNILAVCAGWLSRTGTRVVLREANVLLPRDQMHGLKPHLQRALMRLFYRGSAQIVAVAESVSESLITGLGLPPRLVRTIYNPVVGPDIEGLAAAPVDDPWFAPDSPPVVLGIGRLVPQKDFASLLRAFALVRARRPARLLILGEGAERAMLEALGRDLGIDQNLRLPGFEQNPFRFMSRSPIFALSSIFEGLPGTLIQAMACGCRVVATDAPGGMREILRDCDRSSGRLVPMRDPSALADAITSMLDESARVTVRVRHRVERFTEQDSMDQYLEVLGARATVPAPSMTAVRPDTGMRA
jgi:glycosyltransferase involved in cell wall biosynthesis